MKKIKASKSASDIGLRKGATGAAATRSAFPTLRKKKTYSPPVKKAKGDRADKAASKGPKKIRSTREKKDKDSVDSNIEDAVVVDSSSSPQKVKSERTNSPVGPSKPKAIAGPPKPKKNAGPKVKKDKTRTVFVAEPVVKLEEGPDFGKVTHEITKTKQPANPRQFRQPKMARKKKAQSGIKANITTPITADTGRKTRDRLTRVTSPIKGKVTQSKQWSRNEGWTP